MDHSLICPACGATVTVPFGNRSTDTNTVLWKHDGCPDAASYRRVDDFFVTSLPETE